MIDARKYWAKPCGYENDKRQMTATATAATSNIEYPDNNKAKSMRSIFVIIVPGMVVVTFHFSLHFHMGHTTATTTTTTTARSK